MLLAGEKYAYVNFDDERLIDVTAESLNLFYEVLNDISGGFEYLLLDEVQNVTGWELFVNRLHRNKVKIVITGSNAHLLSRDLATHLTGRHLVYEVYPFSFREFLEFKNVEYPAKGEWDTVTRGLLTSAFEEYFTLGGFPESYRLGNAAKYLQDLYGKIVVRDIAARHSVRNTKALKELALYAASNYSSKITPNKLKKIFELGSVNTVKNYLDYMEDAYLLSLVSSFSFKLKEGLRSPKKVYGIDIGMLRALTTSGQKNTGRLLENVVFLELKRRGLNPEYYADERNRHEVDFVVKDANGKTTLIQVCAELSNLETKEREMKALRHAAGVFKKSRSVILTHGYSGVEDANGLQVECVPVWEWLLDE